jgi:hypothetical protein
LPLKQMGVGAAQGSVLSRPSEQVWRTFPGRHWMTASHWQRSWGSPELSRPAPVLHRGVSPAQGLATHWRVSSHCSAVVLSRHWMAPGSQAQRPVVASQSAVGPSQMTQAAPQALGSSSAAQVLVAPQRWNPVSHVTGTAGGVESPESSEGVAGCGAVGISGVGAFRRGNRPFVAWGLRSGGLRHAVRGQRGHGGVAGVSRKAGIHRSLGGGRTGPRLTA